MKKIVLPFTCNQFWIVFGFIVIGSLWYNVGSLLLISQFTNTIVYLSIVLATMLSLLFLIIYGLEKGWENPFMCKCKE